jgi:hypothetical protein
LPKMATPCEAESFIWLPQHDPRPPNAPIMNDGCLKEPSSLSGPSSLNRYRFSFLQMIRASPGSRDRGVKVSLEPKERSIQGDGQAKAGTE